MPIAALHDVWSAIRLWRVWTNLGWMDIRQRYRGSALGPFWITISMGIFIAALSIVYSRILQQPIHVYVPFLTAGCLVWYFVSSSLIEGTQIFYVSRDYILQIKLPYFLYVLRFVYRHFIIFLHNALIYIAIALIFQLPLSANTWLFLPGLGLVILNIAWVSLLLAMLGARFRDIGPLVSSLIQVLFLASPITWMPHLLNPNSLVLRLNPLTYFLSITRDPLLNQIPPLTAWETTVLISVIGWTITLTIFSVKRRSIAFWV